MKNALPKAPSPKIAFAIYAANACGSSEQAREAEDRKGVALVAQSQDVVTSIQNSSAKLRVGQEGSLTSFGTSKLKLILTAVSNTPSICEVSTNSIVKLISSGDCVLVFSSISDGINKAAEATSILFRVFPSKAEQAIPDQMLKASYFVNDKGIKLISKTTAGLQIDYNSMTDSVCIVRDGEIMITGLGQCLIVATQFGDENTNWAPNKELSFSVVKGSSKTTISSGRGKVTKKVTAVNPKCPAGYKVKK